MTECKDCRQCNRKGKPSVTRFSAHCDSHRIDNTIFRLSLFQSFKNKVKERFFGFNADEKVKGGFRNK